jgi:hypothetical protein
MNNLTEHFAKLANLEYFDPKAFEPDDNVSKEVCGFLLSLALIYNDIKNIALLFEVVKESKPDGNFVERKDWGEYNGIINFLNRINISILHELFCLIKENNKVLEDKFFKQIIKLMRKDAKASWQILVDTSLEKYTDNKLSKDLMIIRNKIASHYDPKAIKMGYDFFYDTLKLMDKAYISRGKNMPETRFYFGDAAGESYIKYLYGSPDISLFYSSIANYLKELNKAVWYIINIFIAKRGFGLRSK